MLYAGHVMRPGGHVMSHDVLCSWGKRAAHNRAQIVYYIAENLELRRAEMAGRIAAMTGREEVECQKEVDLSIQRLFYWGAYADKYGGTVQVRAERGVATRGGAIRRMYLGAAFPPL